MILPEVFVTPKLSVKAFAVKSFANFCTLALLLSPKFVTAFTICSFVEFTSFIERRRFGMKIILIKIIRFYQKYLSALKGRATCIYTPTCSQYAIEAIEKHGVLKGGLLAAWRILRCNPFSKGGYDPVP